MTQPHIDEQASAGAYPWQVDLMITGGFNSTTHHLFYDEEAAATAAYEAICQAVKASNDRLNDAAKEIEVADDIGRITVETHNIGACRLVNDAKLRARGEGPTLEWITRVETAKAAGKPPA